MYRHPSLIPLSREHHGALILSRLLQKNAPAYKGLPTDTEGKSQYAIQFYKEHLVPHFIAEEKAMALAFGKSKNLDELIREILNEHKFMHVLFTTMQDHVQLAEHNNETGMFMEAHIRKEERILFPLMEQTCTEDTMKEIADLLSDD